MLSARLKTVVEVELCRFLSVECVFGIDMVKMYMMQFPVASGSAQSVVEDVGRDATAAATVAPVGKRMVWGPPSRW